MNQYIDALTGMINTSFENDQIYFSGTHTDDQRVVQIDIYSEIHRYLTGRISREHLLQRVQNAFLRKLNVPYEYSIYINDFYIEPLTTEEVPVDSDLSVAVTVTFHVSIDTSHEGD